jgi:photosystem II stability/assembly factor-like uncharacterized protein
LLAIATLAAVLAPSAAMALAPTLVKPYNAVSFADSLHGYIAAKTAANAGALKWTDNGGTSWHNVAVEGDEIVGVTAGATGQVTAVGKNFDALYGSSDFGSSWTTETPLLNRDVHLAGMAYLAGGRRVVVGKLQPSNYEALIASSVNGAAWTIDRQGPYHAALPDQDPPIVYAELAAVDAAPGGATAWAVGYDRTDRTLAGPFDALIYKWSNSGSTWTTQTAPTTTPQGLSCVAAADAQTAYIGQLNSKILLRTINGGSAWTPMPPFATTTGITSVNAIDAYDGDHVLVVGNTLNGQGRIAWTSNAKASNPTWSVNTASAPRALLGAQMITATNWIVVGDDETVLRTFDSGKTWAGNAPPSVPVAVALTMSTGSNSSVAYGSAFKVAGTLRMNATTPVPDQRVILQSTTTAGGAYKDTSYQTTTGTGGTFSFSVKQSTRTWYRVRFAAANGYLATSSSSVYATPKAFVGIPRVPSSMKHTSTYTISGELRPRHTAGTYPVRIYKYRLVRGSYRSSGYVTAKAWYGTSSSTKYSARIRLTTKGKWRMRAYALGDAGHTAAWSSGYHSVTVK